MDVENATDRLSKNLVVRKIKLKKGKYNFQQNKNLEISQIYNPWRIWHRENFEGKSAFEVANHLTDIFMREDVIMGTSGGGGWNRKICYEVKKMEVVEGPCSPSSRRTTAHNSHTSMFF